MMKSYAFFVIGNTFERIAEEDAPLDKTGRHRKTMKWTVYVDVVEGNKDIIAQVEADMGPTFRPRKYVGTRPKEVEKEHFPERWRCFESTHFTYGLIDINFTVTGVGGTPLGVRYTVQGCNYEEPEQKMHHFFEPKPTLPNPFKPNYLPQNVRFRLARVSADDSAASPHGEREHAAMDVVFQNNRQYSSGEEGIECCRNMLQEQSNKRSESRVHVDVHEKSLEDLVKICQNVIKYEDAIDNIIQKFDGMPDQGKDHYKSNKKAVPGSLNKARHEKLASCKTVQELCTCINPEPETPYKFNLLDSGKTVEFCFGMLACDSSVVEALVRFCVHFVHNSARFRSPNNCKDTKTVGEQTNLLFMYVIKDKYVEHCLLLQSIDHAGELSTFTHSDVPIDFMDDLTLDSAVMDIASVTYPTSLPDSFVNACPDQRPPNRKRCRHRGEEEEIQEASDQAVQEHPSPSESRYQVHQQPSPPQAVSSSTRFFPRRLLKGMIREKNKDLNARLLKAILQKVNMSQGRDVGMRLKALLKYFDAREKEISHFFETAGTERKDEGPNFGIELIHANVKPTEFLSIYVRGGLKLMRKRGGVERPDCDQVSCSKLSFEELSEVLNVLGRPIANDSDGRIQELNNYIEEVFTEKQSPEISPENKDGNFAIIHDIPAK